ncbi:hypothetical protein LTSEWAN_0732 [Salmonella enterica subsp. enterica serovar Wandsworth str. A4-580]|uniref:Uncharacterized protein n=1 Tax=Salmonella enterica subsp. enterica serovar Wandsworth str. A4-580 TaxID=913086 RepID=G5S7D7_SALET|nr:hypothetical protein LTSEWAN_0732 [Salmonella enterica subsp. enterica serovar Wandsworth str. A4-580]
MLLQNYVKTACGPVRAVLFCLNFGLRAVLFCLNFERAVQYSDKN